MIKRMFLRIVVWTLAVVSIAAFVAIPVTAKNGPFLNADWRGNSPSLIVEGGVVYCSWTRIANPKPYAPKVIFRWGGKYPFSYSRALVQSVSRHQIIWVSSSVSGRPGNRLQAVVPLSYIVIIAGVGPAMVWGVRWSRRRLERVGFPVETAAEGK